MGVWVGWLYGVVVVRVAVAVAVLFPLLLRLMDVFLWLARRPWFASDVVAGLVVV